MKAPLVMVAAILSLSLAVISCGDAEEQLAPGTPSATPDASPSATPAPSAAPTAFETPSPSAAPVPGDWATYSRPDARLTLRYPSTWHSLKDGGIYSWDPATWDKPWWPPEGMKIDVIYGPSQFAEPRPAEATDFLLATFSGWEITYPKNPAIEDGLTRVHQVALKRGEFTLFIIASFSQANPDEETFSKIVNSLRFAE